MYLIIHSSSSPKVMLGETIKIFIIKIETQLTVSRIKNSIEASPRFIISPGGFLLSSGKEKHGFAPLGSLRLFYKVKLGKLDFITSLGI